MSNVINNREMSDTNRNKRQELLKGMILKLHEGVSPDVVKEEFRANFQGVSSYEISQMEQNLIAEGMTVEEIQNLCDVHADIFKGSVDEVHTRSKEEESIGHPVRVLREENYALTSLLDEDIMPKMDAFINHPEAPVKNLLLQDMNMLWDIDKHYSRKENIIFPYMEKYGMSAPPKVMWGVDDEIRAEIKAVKQMIIDEDREGLRERANPLIVRIKEMIFKEEQILIPMILDKFTEDEWLEIADDSEEVGYCLVSPEGKWTPDRVSFIGGITKKKEETPEGNVRFGIGFLTVKELEKVLNALPVDVTFIDEKDTVKYFNLAKERIFARTKSVIGRTVQNCHPPQSVGTVEKLLADFKAGIKDEESFWINSRGMFILINYYAIRDDNGKYMGTLEVTQNVKGIRELEGEKRILAD
ncbi:DUF438 domain-containing protein [Proteiniclasticum sp.]|uniref:DUF438 domain-containing protein n=1 Tax=Proteiniclasticum sp. TaxID=2053595 RepID=UPI0028982920|nr:DUF438 domain-containing protein [Proteiniclasticum sp.]